MAINPVSLNAYARAAHLGAITDATTDATAAGDKPAAPGKFGELIKEYVQTVNAQEHAADKAAVELATGKNHNVSETLLALQQAEVSFQMMLSVRNKLVDAYREVMRMQV